MRIGSRLFSVCCLAAVALSACGSSSSVDGSIFQGTASILVAAAPCATCDPASMANVAIDATGVSPKTVAVPGSGCGCIVFTNNDTAAHQIVSSPYPTNTDCPDLNMPAGGIPKGQSFTARMTPTVAKTCGWYDALNLPPAPGGGGGGGGY
jgi:hypothetical protein